MEGHTLKLRTMALAALPTLIAMHAIAQSTKDVEVINVERSRYFVRCRDGCCAVPYFQ